MGSKYTALCACRPSVVILFECILIFCLQRSPLVFLATWPMFNRLSSSIPSCFSPGQLSRQFSPSRWSCLGSLCKDPSAGLTLSLVEPHVTGLGPVIQPVHIPMQSLPTLKQEIKALSQQGIILRLTKVQVIPLSRSLIKIIRQDLVGPGKHNFLLAANWI